MINRVRDDEEDLDDIPRVCRRARQTGGPVRSCKTRTAPTREAGGHARAVPVRAAARKAIVPGRSGKVRCSQGGTPEAF